MDTNGCMGASCASLPAQAVDSASKCKVPTRFPENYDGCEYSPVNRCCCVDSSDNHEGIDKLPGM
jgi:hypothetical protein